MKRSNFKRKKTPFRNTQALRTKLSTSSFSRPRITQLPGFITSRTPEIKAVDIPKGNLLFKVAPSPVLLNPIQQGPEYYKRIGARVELKNLHIRGIITPKNSTEPIPGAYGRIVIVYDRSPNGVIPQISDILQTRTQTGATSTTEYSEINLDNRDRFIILRDTEFYLPDMIPTLVNTITQQVFPHNTGKEMRYNEFIKMKGLITHFKGTSNPAGIGDYTIGAVYGIAISNADDNFSLELQTRIRFADN